MASRSTEQRERSGDRVRHRSEWSRELDRHREV